MNYELKSKWFLSHMHMGERTASLLWGLSYNAARCGEGSQGHSLAAATCVIEETPMRRGSRCTIEQANSPDFTNRVNYISTYEQVDSVLGPAGQCLLYVLASAT
jgi:hypothetical protein